MAIIAEMTQLSPTMTEGTIVNWLKKEGDSVSPGEILAEVETDKAVMEMEAYDSGTLLAILAKEGSKVAVGLPVAILGEKGEDITQLKKDSRSKLESTPGHSSEDKPSTKTDSESKDKSNNPQTESQPKGKSHHSKTDNKDNSKSEKKEKSDSPKTHKDTGREKPQTGRILASPLAKSIAIQKSVDLKYVIGSGPGGRILQKDVYDFLENREKASSPGYPTFSKAEDKEISISGMRKTIADRLTSSKNNLPHFYLNVEIDAENLVLFRKKINSQLEFLESSSNLSPKISSNEDSKESQDNQKIKISINDIIVRSVALALERHPVLNSSWQKDKIMQYGRIDIGIAVAIDEGLITPVIRNANQLGLLKTSYETSRLADLAKKRKLKPEEFTNSTFTISNLGMLGIDFFTAIINEPEAAILAVGKVQEKPVVKNGEIVPGKRMQLTLSCDHRVVDGAEGAKFLRTIKIYLENPETLSL